MYVEDVSEREISSRVQNILAIQGLVNNDTPSTFYNGHTITDTSLFES